MALTDTIAPVVDPFVKLADVGDLATARIAVAVLAGAGIEARLHGESLGPYPVTVGRLAITEIWVRATDVREAGLVMLESEIEHVLGAEVRSGALADPGALPMRLAAGFLLVALSTAVVVGLLRVF